MRSIFWDTAVLVAGLDEGHPQHAPCLALPGKLTSGTAFGALPSYAEVYAVMSGKPGKPRLRPTDVDAMVDRLDQVFTPIALTRREYRGVIQTYAAKGVSGGRLYDALILTCGIKSNASQLYTLNE